MADNTDNLYDGITAITDAGDIHGFARECLAEMRTIALARTRAGHIADVSDNDAVTVYLVETLCQVVRRRLKGDYRAIIAASYHDAFAEWVQSSDMTADQVIERADALAIDRMNRITMTVCESLNACYNTR